MATNKDKTTIEIEKEKLRLQRLDLQLRIYQTNLIRRIYRRQNRSWLDKIEDAIFDW